MADILAVTIIIIGSIIGAVGAFLIKKSNVRINIKSIMRNHILIIGVLLYALSPIINIIAYRRGEVTGIYPFFTFTYVWSSLLAVKYLKEKMNIYKLAGISLIIFGAILISI